MELKTFIKEAIKDIMGAVDEAQKEIPSGSVIPWISPKYMVENLEITQLQKIDFEVRVTTEQKQGSEAKINVVAAFIGGGVKGESSSNTDNSTKIKFSIPIKYNVDKKDVPKSER